MLSEELILHYIPKVFKGYQIKEKSLLRVTRNADIDADALYDEDLDYREFMAAHGDPADSGDLLHDPAGRHQCSLIRHLFSIRKLDAEQAVRRLILLDLRESSHFLVEAVVHVVIVALADLA